MGCAGPRLTLTDMPLLVHHRMRYLRDHGFDARLVRYCDEATTSDNLAIICTKRITHSG